MTRNREQIMDAILNVVLAEPDDKADVRARRDMKILMGMTDEEVASEKVQQMTDYRYPATGPDVPSGKEG